MRKAQIAGVSLIANNSKGESINLIAIRLSNGNTLLRNVKQFVTDLDGSFRLQGVDTSFITSVKHPALGKAASKLKGGSVQGDWQPYKEGEEYVVTETMSVITDANHPEYGKVKVGDKRNHTSDGNVITGFLDIEPSMQQKAIEENAEQFALINAQAMGLFNDVSASSAAVSTADELPDFDEALVDETVGSESTAE